MSPLPLLGLAARSAWSRRGALGLTLFAIATSVTMLLAVERVRQQVRTGFEQSVSGTDLLVGARGSPLQLLLYAVFHLGEATHALSWQSVEALKAHPAVAWVLPLSLGDSHRGYPVLATSTEYFEHFRYGDRRPLRFAAGRAFAADTSGVFELVLGARVAQRLAYAPGDTLTLSHGRSERDDHHHHAEEHVDEEHGAPHAEHADKPFIVVGILAPTDTPVDDTLHIGLAGMQAIHLDWQGGAPLPGLQIPADLVRKFDLTPKAVNAALVGLKSRTDVFALQAWVNAYRDEPLMGVLPGVALSQLWQLLGQAERALRAIAALVVVMGLAGLVAVVLAGLNERRRELAILRSVGASPRDILLLVSLEGLGLTVAAVACGLGALTALSLLFGPLLAARWGLHLVASLPTPREWALAAAVIVVGLLASLLPAWRAFRLSLADGLTPRH